MIDKPGPELNAKIAIELFEMAAWEEKRGEYKFVIFQRQDWTPRKGSEDRYRRINVDEIDRMNHIAGHLPDYSREWEGMQMVVEEMDKREWDFTLTYSNGIATAQFGSAPHSQRDSAPFATAMAALKALEDSQNE